MESYRNDKRVPVSRFTKFTSIVRNYNIILLITGTNIGSHGSGGVGSYSLNNCKIGSI